MSGLDAERLAAIRERAANATEGPWWIEESDDTWVLQGVAFKIPPIDEDWPEQIVNKQILKAPKNGTPYAEYWPDAGDAALIVNATEDVEWLLSLVARLEAEAADAYQKGREDAAEAIWAARFGCADEGGMMMPGFAAKLARGSVVEGEET